MCSKVWRSNIITWKLSAALLATNVKLEAGLTSRMCQIKVGAQESRNFSNLALLGLRNPLESNGL